MPLSPLLDLAVVVVPEGGERVLLEPGLNLLHRPRHHVHQGPRRLPPAQDAEPVADGGQAGVGGVEELAHWLAKLLRIISAKINYFNMETKVRAIEEMGQATGATSSIFQGHNFPCDLAIF